MLEVLAELIAEMRARFMDEIEQAYAKNFNMLRLDIDALRHEIRKFAGTGAIELPSFFGSEQKRANWRRTLLVVRKSATANLSAHSANSNANISAHRAHHQHEHAWSQNSQLTRETCQN
jgi:hypothetical protein